MKQLYLLSLLNLTLLFGGTRVQAQDNQQQVPRVRPSWNAFWMILLLSRWRSTMSQEQRPR